MPTLELPAKIQITQSAVGLSKEIFADIHIKFAHKAEFMVMDWKIGNPLSENHLEHQLW